jgi:DNA-binding transcriptional LysR family regulator
MELRHLRYFVPVAEELHFRRAGERLHVAQPAISEQIRKLEAERGARLFNRTPRGMSLTDGGAARLGEARRVLQQTEVARLAAPSAHDRATSRLRIGYMSASPPASVPPGVRHVAASMPQLETTLEPGIGMELIEAVRRERLDALIVPLPAPGFGLRTTALADQRGVAALPVGHAQAVRPGVRVEQIAPDRIIVLPRDATVRSMTPRWLPAPTPACRPRSSSCRTPTSSAFCWPSRRAWVWRCYPSAPPRFAAPGVGFVPPGGDRPAFATAVVTRRETAHMPTVAFLGAVSHADRMRTLRALRTPVSTAA